ncbi:alcohol oxidase [Aureobasidium sp. EXF-12298]|nr:alcohol oxidase [Aureobasidium sp. EXF-12298]KAI4757752.1 alcohol oxidase [Aureobasidium sp. EXF-12344]KAI4774835.1 alcohol oxidase [Aureobasidium sp. EXF-3400]
MAPVFSSLTRLTAVISSVLLLSADVVLGTTTREKTLTGTYDYIIVGGGVSGLVVANRLSEKSQKSVLVLEYGYNDNSTKTLWPYYGTAYNDPDMFEINCTPQKNLQNQTFVAYAGKVLGGGSIVNGMGYDRGTQPDYDAWGELGNDGWNWGNLLTYFKKSSTFTPNKKETLDKYNYTYDLSAYGSGPVQVSLPEWQYPEMPAFWDAMDEMKINKVQEGALGEPGHFWVPASTDPKYQTRSSARTAYYDPIASRSNLKVVTGVQVQEIVFATLTAKGVRLLDRDTGKTYTAYANMELILAAGAIHTPQILQLSGVGPASVLKEAGVKVKVDLPGVGNNFQDHPAAYLMWNFNNDTTPNTNSLTNNATFNATSYDQYVANKTGPYTQAHGNGAAFLPLSKIAPDTYKTIVNRLTSQNAADYLPAMYSDYPELVAGYEAQRKIQVEQFNSVNASMYEFSFQGGGFAITALQKPTSRGTVYLDPKNPYGEPIIDYHGLQNPVDMDLLLASIRYTRQIYNTTALSVFEPVELTPGTKYQTDDELKSQIASGLVLPTFAHPASSCAMMPRNLGGVVDSGLQVYGIKKVTIVDASIMPLIPGTHLQATVYAVAEKAADIIKARHGAL